VALTAGVAVLVLVATVLLVRRVSDGPGEPSGAAPPSASASAPPTTAEIYAAVAPSVVTVEATGPGTTAVVATGTGVVATGEGVIVTALSVVGGGGPVRVTFADGTPAPAIVFATDPATDIALLTVLQLPAVVVPAVLGNSGRMAVGDSVVAVGNQVGMTSSATSGVVSGLNRTVTGADGRSRTGLIQFDAAVNPGSFGGPLVTGRGETVAIVVSLANPTAAGTFIGVGFAVPIGAAVAAGGDGRGPQQ
jgi:putative serine protease PepD